MSGIKPEISDRHTDPVWLVTEFCYQRQSHFTVIPQSLFSYLPQHKYIAPMRLLRLPSGPAIRLIRGYAASAPKLEPETEVEVGQEAESSTTAQRRLWPAPPSPGTSTTRGRRAVKSRTIDPDAPVKAKLPRSPRALALIRAQQLAQALKESSPLGPGSTSFIPPPTTYGEDRQENSSQDLVPTIEDLEAKRPTHDPPPILSRRYSKRYKRLYDQIDKAFVLKQLLKLAPQLGVRVPRGRNKRLAISGILESWGWGPPVDLDKVEARERTINQILENDWEMSGAELYLIMRDTESLRPIMEQGVRFSILTAPSSSSTISSKLGSKGIGGARVLRGTGTQASLADLDHFIRERRSVSVLCAHS